MCSGFPFFVEHHVIISLKAWPHLISNCLHSPRQFIFSLNLKWSRCYWLMEVMESGDSAALEIRSRWKGFRYCWGFKLKPSDISRELPLNSSCKIDRRNYLVLYIHGKNQKNFQSIMNTIYCQHSFWPSHENGHVKILPIISHNLHLNFTSGFLYDVDLDEPGKAISQSEENSIW